MRFVGFNGTRYQKIKGASPVDKGKGRPQDSAWQSNELPLPSLINTEVSKKPSLGNPENNIDLCFQNNLKLQKIQQVIFVFFLEKPFFEKVFLEIFVWERFCVTFCAKKCLREKYLTKNIFWEKYFNGVRVIWEKSINSILT